MMVQFAKNSKMQLMVQSTNYLFFYLTYICVYPTISGRKMRNILLTSPFYDLRFKYLKKTTEKVLIPRLIGVPLEKFFYLNFFHIQSAFVYQEY